MDVLNMKKMAAAALAVVLGAIIVCVGVFPVCAVASESSNPASPASRAAALIIKSNVEAGGAAPVQHHIDKLSPIPVSSSAIHQQIKGSVEVEHNFVLAEVVEPTCAEAGYSLYSCQYCGQTYKDSLVASLPHEFVENVVEPACTHRGYTTYACTRCSYAYLDPDSYKDETDHSYVDTVVPSTCEMMGYTVHTCKICGDEYADSFMPVLGHDFSQLVEEGTEPQCQYPGTAPTKKCTRCGEMSGGEEIAPLGHNIVDTPHAATCEMIGYTQHSCSRCEQGYIDNLVPPLGHNYETSVVDPTCTDSGFTIRICSRCNDFAISDRLPALGHHHIANTVNSTCIDGGYIEYECDRCHDVFTEVVNPGDHEYIEEVVAPTCTKPGYTSHTCVNCNHSYTDNEIDALGHDYDVLVVEPTCTNDGYTTSTCKRCGNISTEKTGDALGHEWGDHSWIWSNDHLSASLTFKCLHDPAHIRSIRAVVESETIDTTTTYIATVTIDGQLYTDERSVTTVVSDPVRDPIPGGNQNGGSSGNSNSSNDSNGGNTAIDPVAPGDKDNASSNDGSDDSKDPSQGVTSAVVAQSISVSTDDSKSDGFNAIITNAPEGTKELSVASVEEGNVFNALTTAVADDVVKEEADAEIAGVYDVKLSIDGTNYAQSFGKLTLEFPVDEKYNMHWAKIYHCHNNDTSNITTFEKVIAMDGKVVLNGVTRLSMFAVAMGERVEESAASISDFSSPDVTEVVQLTANQPTLVTGNASSDTSSSRAVVPTNRVTSSATPSLDAAPQEAVAGDVDAPAANGDPISAQLREGGVGDGGANPLAPSISSAIESAMNTPVATVSGIKISLFHVGIVAAVILLAAASSILVFYFRKRRA